MQNSLFHKLLKEENKGCSNWIIYKDNNNKNN